MSCVDNKDGSCSVEYVPYEPGTYNLNITYGGQPITGKRSAPGDTRRFLLAAAHICLSGLPPILRLHRLQCCYKPKEGGAQGLFNLL